MEEYLEHVLREQNRVVCIMFPLVQLPAEADPVSKEGCGKENFVSLRNSNGSKIVLTLLIEVIVVYVRLSVIYVQGIGFQWLFPRLLGGGKSWSGSNSGSGSSSLQNSLQNLLQVIFGILRDISSSGGILWP